MGNKRRCIYFVLCFLLTVVLSGRFNIVQADAYDDKGIKLDVDNNKSWIIKFNKELDGSTIDESRFVVTDESGQQVPVGVVLGADGKSVVVSPKSEYGYGKTYNLFVKDGIKSTSKNSLVKTTKMQFTVKSNKANDFNKAYTVTIDAGHGGSDTGNIGQNAVKEKDINLSVALKLGKILQDNGVNVVYTRKSDTVSWDKNNDLQSRFDIANNAKSDFFISIHCNAYPEKPTANGIETYYSGSDEISKALAQSVQSELVSNTGLSDRGIKVGLSQHEILRGTIASPIMVQLGFLTNEQESATIASEQFQNNSAADIANGILKSLSLIDKSKEITTISSISNLSVNVAQGDSYSLPLNVTATMSDGSSKKVNVIWEYNTVNTSEIGSYSYKGTVAGYSTPISLLLTVGEKDTRDVICIDPGHGVGGDTGASGIDGLQEDDVTLAVGLEVGRILEEHDIKVVYTRTEDMRSTSMSVVDSLQRRCDIANNANAKYFVSIHANSFDSSSALGTETLYDTENEESKKLATAIQNSIIKEVGTYDRGLKDGNWLYLVNHANSPTVLTELGFLTNPGDAEKLKDPSYQQKYAQAIANGILETLGK